MFEELVFLNHWLKSKEVSFPTKYGITKEHCFVLSNIWEFIDNFILTTKCLPTVEAVAVEFEDFNILSDLDPVNYAVNKLKEQKAYMDYRPMLERSAVDLNEGVNAIDLMYRMRNELDEKLKGYTSNLNCHDWVKDAMYRYEKYMETHEREGLAGLSTGIESLDDLTGGWRFDDMILLAGRTGEGKSLLGVFFSYNVWRDTLIAKLDNPVIYFSTEMPELEVAYRLDTLRKHFSNRELNEGRLSNSDIYKEYLNEFSNINKSFIIVGQEANDNRPFTVVDIQAFINEYKPIFIVIDQLYDLSDGTNERDIRKQIVNVTKQLRNVILQTKVPVLLIAQAGRGAAREARRNEQATPELEDVQESDNPAQKATRVLTLKQIGDIIKISLKKNRGGVKDQDIFLRSTIDMGYYEEIDASEINF